MKDRTPGVDDEWSNFRNDLDSMHSKVNNVFSEFDSHEYMIRALGFDFLRNVPKIWKTKG